MSARRDAVSEKHLQPERSTNLALWLDRYAIDTKQEQLRLHHGTSLSEIRVPDGYPRAFERRRDALRRLAGDYAESGGHTRLFIIALTGRAVLGIGAASVRETNLSLLRPWGVPYLPGSSLKGLASRVAHASGDSRWARPAHSGGRKQETPAATATDADTHGDAPAKQTRAGAFQQAIFGDTKAAGAVVFHDAWWVPRGELLPVALDTMTVHQALYYQGSAPPSDSEEPNPVSFLTMRDRYLFAMTGPADALDVVERILMEGLREQGLGAKTAAGYGRAEMEVYVSDVQRLLDGLKRSDVENGTVRGIAEEFLRLAERVSFPDEESAARKAAERLFAANPKVWRAWLPTAPRTEDLSRWFASLLAPKPEIVAPPPKPGPEPKSEAPSRRNVRVWYSPDKKDPKRFEVRFEGEKKLVKYHLLHIEAAVLEAMKAHEQDGVVVEVEFEQGKPKKLLLLASG